MAEATNVCKYCFKELNMLHAEWLKCNDCNSNIHITCLKRQATPGGLHGDVFFQFRCEDCTEDNVEKFIREKMTWFKVIILVLYHLQHKTPGTAKKGFFHWKIHLVTFIDKKWDILFPRDFKRRKNWMGTVSGSLSHFSPCFLISGINILGEPGWWRLTFPKLTPSLIVSIYSELLKHKQKNSKVFDELSYVKILVSRYIPIEEDIFPKNMTQNKQKISLVNDTMPNLDLSHDPILDSSLDLLHHDYQITDHINDFFNIESDESLPKKFKVPLAPSLFAKATKSNFVKFWNKMEQTSKPINESNIVPLRANEEQVLLQYVNERSTTRSTCALKRKLIVRSIKRKQRIRLFNVDDMIKSKAEQKVDKNDRFCHYKTYPEMNTNKIIVVSGGEIKDYFCSPYTNRLLRPYIRRNLAPKALWLRLMSEMHFRVNHKPPKLYSVDYCYFRPSHLPAINYLCEQFFWPGIDLSDALEYPEFSCVALYQKLIVGFAFMVPDVKFNEAYISFIFTRPEWRGIGIGKFMIYHLIQTCMGKDITLHVAMDNPALLLYQKFGFKVEEVVINFYDTYLRDDSKQCKHAFFLRLER